MDAQRFAKIVYQGGRIMDSAYCELKTTLFPRMRKYDFIDHFVCQFLHAHLKAQSHVHITRVLLGNVITERIALQPKPGTIERTGREFCAAIARVHNEQYWLIRLWLRMFADARHSKLGREIVRAFIKHCINVTAHEIAQSGKPLIDRSLATGRKLAARDTYYDKIFSVDGIVRSMRRPLQGQWSSRRKGRGASQAIRIARDGLSPSSAAQLKTLFQENGLAEYIELIEISRSRASGPGVRSPLEALASVWVTFTGKRKIIREMRRILGAA